MTGISPTHEAHSARHPGHFVQEFILNGSLIKRTIGVSVYFLCELVGFSPNVRDFVRDEIAQCRILDQLKLRGFIFEALL